MKNVIYILLTTIFSFVIIYFIASFITLDLNLFNWTQLGRAIYVVISLCILAIMLLIMDYKKII